MAWGCAVVSSRNSPRKPAAATETAPSYFSESQPPPSLGQPIRLYGWLGKSVFAALMTPRTFLTSRACPRIMLPHLYHKIEFDAGKQMLERATSARRHYAAPKAAVALPHPERVAVDSEAARSHITAVSYGDVSRVRSGTLA